MKLIFKFILIIWLVIYFFTFLLPKGRNFIDRFKRSSDNDYVVSTQFADTKETTSFDKSRFLLLEEMKKIPKDKYVLFYTPDFYDYVLFDFHLYPLKLIHTQSLMEYFPYVRGEGRRLEKKVLEKSDLENFDYFVVLKNDVENMKGVVDDLKQIFRDENSVIYELSF